MLKHITLLSLLLVGSVAASVLSAWGCARWEETHPLSTALTAAVSEVPRDTREYLCDSTYESGFGPDRDSGFHKEVRRSAVCTIITYTRWHDAEFLGYSRTQSSHRYGLPFRAMQRDERHWGNPAAYPEFGSYRLPDARGGWPIAPEPVQQNWFNPGYSPPAHVYPITPIPVGLTLNSLLFFVTFLGLIRGPSAVRAWNRRRRGLCRRCACPRGNSPVCTECGQAL